MKYLTIILLLFSYCTFGQTNHGATPNLRSGIISYWKFEETSGITSFDETANSNDGTINGATVNQTGKVGQCYDYNGSSDYVSIPNSSSLQFGTDNITISMWFNGDVVDAGLFSLYVNYYDAPSGDDPGIIVRVQNGLIRTLIGNSLNAVGSRSFRDNATALNTATWYHLVVVWINSNGSIDFYINGSLDNGSYGEQTAANDNISNTVDPISIGVNENTSSQYFNGKIDELTNYKRSFSLLEVKQAYNSGDGLLYVYENFINGKITFPEYLAYYLEYLKYNPS